MMTRQRAINRYGMLISREKNYLKNFWLFWFHGFYFFAYCFDFTTFFTGGAPLVPNRSTTEFEVDSAEANGNGYSNGRRTSFDSQNDPYFDGGGYGGPPAAYR